jgi:hypothetical protein
MRILYVLLLVLASGSAAAQDPPARPAEYLVTMPLAGLAARTREREGVTQIDWVPSGETPDSARRMITIERLSGAAGDAAPMHMLRGLATCFSPCPGETQAPIDQAPFHGRPAARVTINMPARAHTGRPTRAYALAVSGERDLHFIAVIVRGEVSPADERFAQDVLRSVVLCVPGSRAAACGAD